MLKNIQNIHESTRCRIKDSEKALIFQHIYEGNAVTRKQLAESLRLRPTTVSNVVQELVSDNLVFEGTGRYPGKKGRPEIRLRTNFNRFTAIAVHVVSRELKGVLVNLGYETLADSSLVVPGDTGNSVLYRSIDNLASSLSRENPSGAELTGISLSLPGTVNLRQKSWISAARWPSLNNLKISKLERSSPADLSLCRFLDAELEYLLSIESGYRQGGTLLFHWGYGIGSAFAINGKVLRSTLGRFGEIGHVPLGNTEKKCFCGAYGCLETEAALWSLLPELRKYGKDIPEDEHRFADVLNRDGLDTTPVVLKAVDFICLGLTSLYQIFYPDRILVYGPFFRSERIFTTLIEKFRSGLPEYARDSVSIQKVTGELHGTIIGSTYSFFRNALRRYLIARWET